MVEEALTRVGVSVSELMHRAGLAASQEVMRLGQRGTVAIFVGLGNNGGDGWVAAEDLLGQGMDVCVVSPVAPEDLKGDLARVVATSAQTAGVRIMVAPPRGDVEELLLTASVIVDAMLGTGFRGEPRAPFDIWIDCINGASAQVVSVDVPSGLSAQTGHAAGDCVIADVTVTMLTLKPGLLSDRGRDVCGSVVVAPLAEQTEQLAVEADPVAWRVDLPDYLEVMEPPTAAVDKFTRGSVLVVAGSTRYPGAAMMAARAAARAGAGYVTLAVPSPIVPTVQAHMMEIPVIAMPSNVDGTFSSEAVDLAGKLAKSYSAVLVGPGMRVTSGTSGVVGALIESNVPLVIDADGLNCLSRLTSNQLDDFPEMLRRTSPVILTPHHGELGRMVGLQDNPPDSLTAALEAARRIVWAEGGSELTVVAKGSATACVSVEIALLPKPGPSTLATAGSGDVLSGIITALLAGSNARQQDLPLLAALACEIHGYAAALAAERYGSRGVMAGDIIEAIGVARDALEEHASYPEEQQDE